MEDLIAIRRTIIEELPEEMKAIETGDYNEVLNELPYLKIEEKDSSLLSYRSVDGYARISFDGVTYKEKYNRYKWYGKLLNKIFKGEYWAQVKIELLGKDDYWYFETPLTTKALHETDKRLRRYIKALHGSYLDTLRKEEKKFSNYIYKR